MTSADRQHERVKGALHLRGVSLADIARQLGVTPTTVTVVSKGHRRSRRIENAIAQALGLSPRTVWPERYRGEATEVSPKAMEEVVRDT